MSWRGCGSDPLHPLRGVRCMRPGDGVSVEAALDVLRRCEQAEAEVVRLREALEREREEIRRLRAKFEEGP